jgi:hypothetical protein
MFLENQINSRITLANLAANGVLGTVANVNNYAHFAVNQTAGTDETPIVATLPTPTIVDGSTFTLVSNEGTGRLSMYNKLIKPAKVCFFVYSNGAWRSEEQPLISGNIIAKTPYNAGPETVVVFDNMEIKWHQSGSSYDGIAIRSTTTPISLRYTSSEFYLANAAADGGKSVYGSNNAWYNLPNLGATATIINAVYPYAQTIGTTFLGMGNPAMPNADYRLYKLYNDTTQTEYEIIVDKQGSTGEITTAQTGTCSIVVRKIGITTNQILTATQGIEITNGVIKNADRITKKALPIATAHIGSEVLAFGEFDFRYSTTLAGAGGSNGNLFIRSTTAKVGNDVWWNATESFIGTITPNGAASFPMTANAWTQVGSFGAAIRENIKYYIHTINNSYTVNIVNTNDTQIHFSVEKM